MTVTLRTAQLSDKDRCIALLTMLADTAGDTISANAGCTFDALLDELRGQMIIAEEESVILGLATVSYNVALRYGGEYCQLEELIVDPAARGKNVGGLLMKETITRARQRGCAEYGLYLVETTENNRPFYEKYGFKKVGSEMRQSLV